MKWLVAPSENSSAPQHLELQIVQHPLQSEQKLLSIALIPSAALVANSNFEPDSPTRCLYHD